MTAHIRPASQFDLRGMVELLNEIISIGGTTALTESLTREALSEFIQVDNPDTICHVAVDDNEACLGFQWVGPWPELPPEACEISTFVKTGKTGLGIGSRLFDATREAATKAGFHWINANIRSDNESGLTYYQSRGFRTYGHLDNQQLDSGLIVQKTLKRFDLKD